jgi:hypothetical protein
VPPATLGNDQHQIEAEGQISFLSPWDQRSHIGRAQLIEQFGSPQLPLGIGFAQLKGQVDLGIEGDEYYE